MASVQIDVTAARAQLTKLTDRAAAGEVFELTKRGKVVAVLGPPAAGFVTPDITKPVVEKKASVPTASDVEVSATIAEVTTSAEGGELVDDWGLPLGPKVATVESSPMAVAGEVTKSHTEGDITVIDEMKVDSVSVHDVKKLQENFERASGQPALDPPNPEPLKPWKAPMGLSKSQQAGGKYER